MFGKRILILVPHPDDEIVACCAAIGRAQAEGAAIFAIYLTHGCIAREILWRWDRRHYQKFVDRRRAEAEQVAEFLGIQPVGWSPRPARHLWREMPEVATEIRNAIEQYAIDQIWVPAYEGGNADHDGLNGIAAWLQARVPNPQSRLGQIKSLLQKITSSIRPPLSVLEFAEYNFAGHQVHSQGFPFPNGSEELIKLTPEERATKQAALAMYKSEKQNLNYVKVKQECWRPLADYDYARPPHTGTLWYQRFQWVPFRHPRVDFTNPADVSETIDNFLKNKKKRRF